MESDDSRENTLVFITICAWANILFMSNQCALLLLRYNELLFVVVWEVLCHMRKATWVSFH